MRRVSDDRQLNPRARMRADGDREPRRVGALPASLVARDTDRRAAGHDLRDFAVDRADAARATGSRVTSTSAMMPVQRVVQGWADAAVNAGTTVFHVTSVASAQSIITHGIQPVANQFGGGRLGSGFYTHTAMASAANYYQGETPIALELTIDRNMHGQVAPQDVYVGTTKGLDLDGNDFITAHEDGEERCFRTGGLTVVAVHQGGNRYTPAEWMSFG